MNSQQKAVVAGVLLMAFSVLALHYMGKTQKLGQPGVKVIRQDVFTLVENKKELIGTNMVALPEVVLDYVSTNEPIAAIVFNWLPKDTTYGHRLYVSPVDKFQIDSTVVLMGADRTSIHQPQYCLTGGGWQIIDDRSVPVPIQGPQPYELSVRKIVAKGIFKDTHGDQREFHGVYVYWFVSANQSTSDLKQAMWWLARDVLATGVMQRWAYVSYLAVGPPGSEDASFERVKSLIQASVPEFVLEQPQSVSANGQTAHR